MKFKLNKQKLSIDFITSVKRLLLICFLCLNVLAYSQTTNLSLEVNNKTIKECITTLQQNSDYEFAYSGDLKDLSKTVTLNLTNKSIKSILDNLFSSTNLSYKLVDTQIMISEQKLQAPKQIKGVVKDQTGEPLPGVNVVIKGTTTGVITDIDGNFDNLTVRANDIIVVSSMGFETKEIKVGNQTQLNVTLGEDAVGLDEVVVVGYGTQKKVNLTGAVATVSSKEFENKAASSTFEAIQGKVPNLNINFSGGGIDSDPAINIRGINGVKIVNGSKRLTGQPLVLIDNVPSSIKLLSQMNTEDIESISVLKDASASAIYGGRASFGVILVTTKKGLNEKLNISISFNRRISKDVMRPKFVNSYEHAITCNEARVNRGQSSRFKDDYVQKLKAYHEDPDNNPIDELVNVKKDADGNIIEGDYYYFGTVNYMDEVFDDFSVRDKYGVNVSGSVGNTSLYTSLGYIKDEGMFSVGNEDLKVYNFRLNTNTEINDNISVYSRVSYTKHKYDRPLRYYFESSDYTYDYYDETYFQRTYFPIKNRYNGKMLNSPLAHLSSGTRDVYDDDDIRITGGAEVKLIDGLVFKGSYTYNSSIGLNKENAKKFLLQDNFGYRYPVHKLWTAKVSESHIFHRTKKSIRNIIDGFLQYEKTFLKKHYFKVMAGYNQEDYNSLYYNAKRKDVISESVPSLNLTLGEDYVSQSEYHWAVRGVFYRLNYAFDDKYLFEVNGRYDGTSRFGKDNRFGFFPSASLGWVISKEPFMKFSKKWLDFLKVRASYGSIGNQDVSTYAYIATMDTYKPSYLLGNEKPTAVKTPGLISPDLTWETVNSKNIGLEFRMLNNRLTFESDMYIRDTKDMLVQGEKLPGILGSTVPTNNAGDLRTKGWSVNINWRDNLGDFSYGLGFLVYDSWSEITRYDNPTGALFKKFRVGERLGDIWGYETEGFFNTKEEANEAKTGGKHDQSYISKRDWKPGDIKYKDLNGDGKINEGNMTEDDHGDLKIIGNSQARYKYGITLSLGWKDLSMDAFFQGVGQREFMPSGSIFWPYNSSWDNLQKHQMNSWWTEDNKDAYFPQLEAEASRNHQTQTKYLQDASYIRLKNLSINYALPQKWVQKIGLNSVVVSLQGQNLWEHHNLPEPYDPEGGNGLQVPYKRSYSFGLKVNL
jgi:TonB-linked SusC/RagA family outer membrane protein